MIVPASGGASSIEHRPPQTARPDQLGEYAAIEYAAFVFSAESRRGGYAPKMSPEVTQLLAALEELRGSVLKKLAGLGDEDARRSTVGSGTNLAGLVQHLTFVESLWFEEIVGGAKASRGSRTMHVDPATSLRELRSDYRAACTSSNAIIAGIGDADALVIHNGKSRDLRWVLLTAIKETARHAGHADIIREQIDGQTGR